MAGGALRQRLETLGLVRPGSTISVTVLRQAAKGQYGPKTAARAQAALRLRGQAVNPKGKPSGYKQAGLFGMPEEQLTLRAQHAKESAYKPKDVQGRLLDAPRKGWLDYGKKRNPKGKRR